MRAGASDNKEIVQGTNPKGKSKEILEIPGRVIWRMGWRTSEQSGIVDVTLSVTQIHLPITL